MSKQTIHSNDAPAAIGTYSQAIRSGDFVLPTEIPENDMLERRILIETRTNNKTHDGCERPAAFHNSVVKSVLGWAE